MPYRRSPSNAATEAARPRRKRHVVWNRRQFLRMSGGALAVWPGPRSPGPVASVTLFLGGDVMTGRGIDQVLPRPSSPRLHEAYVGSALGYVELAERAHGSISRPVTFSYVWGDLLSDLERRSPDLRIVNRHHERGGAGHGARARGGRELDSALALRLLGEPSRGRARGRAPRRGASRPRRGRGRRDHPSGRRRRPCPHRPG